MSDRQTEQIRGKGNPTRLILLVMLVASITIAPTAEAQELIPPYFSKVFLPDTIGPGSVSTLQFTIDNTNVEVSTAPVDDMAFTDILPAGVTIATPANTTSTCGGTLSAPDGGGTISLNGGQVGANSVCTITVDVNGTTVGTHTNLTGALTSDAGNSGTATDDLNVVTTLPGFSKSFSPSSVPLGGRSTLTFAIDNSQNASSAVLLAFTDNLPTGLVVADPANVSDTCDASSTGIVNAIPGTGIISYSNGSVGVDSICAVSVDVVSTGGGLLHNMSGELTSVSGFTTLSSGKASDTLSVTVTPIALSKTFTDDPVPPGSTVTLDFKIENFDRSFSATGVAFTDDLTTLVPALAGLTFDSLVSNDCGGSVSGAGGTTIGFSGGTVAPGASCTISTRLSVPSSATPNTYTNTTSAVTGTIGGSPVTGNMASDDLFVDAEPIFTKEFIDDPTTGGGTVTLRFTITNTDPASALTGIDFTDDLNIAILGLAANGLVDGSGLAPDPLVDPCGMGSLLTIPDPNDTLPSPPFPALPPDPTNLIFTGGSLAVAGSPGDSCSFDVVLDVPAGTPSGSYPNTTSPLTATPTGASPASDALIVVAAPTLTKEFTDDPVAPGGTATLEFTVSHPLDASTDATGISFTDDLAPVLAGLTATLPPTPDPPCGAGSSLTGSAGDTLLTLMGGTLMPGETCTFSVTLDVPAAAAPGNYTNTTSGVSATVSGLAVTSAPATDILSVSGLTFSKEFTDDPVIAGATVTLQFTIANIHPTENTTDIAFTDDLALVLPGVSDLTATLPPMVDTCGGMMSGPTSLSYTGGSVTAGSTCTIEMAVLVPAGTADGQYPNLTSSLTATQGGAVTVAPAFDELTVSSNVLQLTKAFTDDPMAPGDTVNLRFTLDNLDAGQAASSIAFTDDLGAVLAGLATTGLPFAACGGTVAAIPDASTIDFSGGSLPAGGQCQFDVAVSVPGGAAAGLYGNTTSSLTGDIGGFAVTGDPASDNLQVLNLLQFSKSFDGPTTANGTPVLSFTITNPGGSAAANIGFSDDLDSVISGLVATNLPLSNVCGTGSQLSGTSFIIMTGGNLPPMGGTCTVNVDLLVPGSATAGTFPNTTSDLLQAGLTVSPPATADLVVEPPPTFAKAFAPVGIAFGGVSTLTFTIDNTASSFAATGLDFSDNLPAGIVVATPANASTTCTGGTLTAVAGSGVLSYTGGSVAAGATCTVQADVMGAASGAFVNTTGDLTSSSGNSGPASATLNVSGAAPAISKAFGSSTVVQGGTTTLSFTITNTDLLASATDITFTDDLDAALPGMVATDTPLTDPCGAGSQLTGTSLLTLTGGTLAPGASCNFTVTVSIPDTASPGLFTNTSSAVSATVGGTPVAGDPADAAQDSVTVLAAAAAAIPTLSQWGLLLLVLLMSTAGVLILRRY